MVKRFVITGCSRSGTKYMSKLMSKLGCETHHDKTFLYHRNFDFEWEPPPYGGASWYIAPVLFKLPKSTIIFHQIRNPLQFIRSRVKKGKADFMWVKRFLKNPKNTINFYAKLWVDWNKFVEIKGSPIKYYISEINRTIIKEFLTLFLKQPLNVLKLSFKMILRIQYMKFKKKVYYYKIEHMNIHLIKKIFNLIDFPYDKKEIEEAYENIPKNVNTTGPYKTKIELNDIKSRFNRYKLKKYAQKFNYL